MNNNRCIICEKEFESHYMFGDRCYVCQLLGFMIWGFGEAAAIERDKKYSLEDQKNKIAEKKAEQDTRVLNLIDRKYYG